MNFQGFFKFTALFLSLWVFSGLSLNAGATGWIGCEACRPTGVPMVSPACVMCSTPQFPTVPSWGMPQLPYCPHCFAQPALPPQQPALNQWWMGYQPHYWNFYMPGPYDGMGMRPQYFPQPPYTPPGGEGIYMAKPVVYVRGPKNAKVEIEVKAAQGEIIVAVPMLRQWKAEIDGSTLKTAEGHYDFFFYDAWVDHNGLQDGQGTCGNRLDTLAYMENLLKQSGFPDESVQDFRATWSVKLPHQQELCVFPQTEAQLKSGVQLSFKPATVRLTQLEFVVVPKRFFGSVEAQSWKRFSKEPKSEFVYRRPASESDGGKDQIRVFDWGVGFLRMSK